MEDEEYEMDVDELLGGPRDRIMVDRSRIDAILDALEDEEFQKITTLQ